MCPLDKMGYDPGEGTGVYCNHCGCEMIIENLRYACPYCWRVLKEHVEPVKGRNWALLVSGIVFLLAVAGVVLYIFLR